MMPGERPNDLRQLGCRNGSPPPTVTISGPIRRNFQEITETSAAGSGHFRVFFQKSQIVQRKLH
jgi:hypothetical protein